MKLAENKSPVIGGAVLTAPVAAYSIVFAVSLDGQALGPSLLTPPMHFTISVGPERTVRDVTAAPNGTSTVPLGARRTMSKLVKRLDPLTTMSTVSMAPGATGGPGIVGAMGGQDVEGCGATQTSPPVEAWAGCSIPGAAYHADIARRGRHMRTITFFNKVVTLTIGSHRPSRIYILGRIENDESIIF